MVGLLCFIEINAAQIVAHLNHLICLKTEIFQVLSFLRMPGSYCILRQNSELFNPIKTIMGVKKNYIFSFLIFDLSVKTKLLVCDLRGAFFLLPLQCGHTLKNKEPKSYFPRIPNISLQKIYTQDDICQPGKLLDSNGLQDLFEFYRSHLKSNDYYQLNKSTLGLSRSVHVSVFALMNHPMLS